MLNLRARQWLTHLRVLFLFWVISPACFATSPPQTAIPASVQPAQVQKAITATLPAQSQPLSEMENAETAFTEQAAPHNEQAKQITFKLTKIILSGNHLYSDATLAELYQGELNKIISVADLYTIVQRITNYYRNHGYILSRAILPPQHVANGEVRLQIIEGFVSKAHVIGDPQNAKAILERYAEPIVNSRPLQVAVMKHYLLIDNEIPGVQTKAVLQPSSTTPEAADLNLQTQTKNITGYLSYDNYGTRYIGPQQITANLGANSVWLSGDNLQGIYSTTTRGVELNFYDVSYSAPLGNQGLRWLLDSSKAITNPQYTLEPYNIRGIVVGDKIQLQYPLIRSQTHSLTVQGGLNYLDSQTTSENLTLYVDHIRSFSVGTTYSGSDQWQGINGANLTLSEGLPLFGATLDKSSLTTSRYGASAVFTKAAVDVSRSQNLWKSLSLYSIVQGQYSFNPLLVSEQYAFGGSQLGRGYDPAEITGDNGLAGSIELRYDLSPWSYLQSLQLYTFYDIGQTWLSQEVAGLPSQQSAASAGGGIRFTLTSYLSGNLMLGQPLTKLVATEEQAHRGRVPRLFFNMIAML